MTPREVVARGKELYESRKRPTVEAGNTGKYVAINVNTGDYEVGSEYLQLSRAVQSRDPHAEIAILRIGCRAVGRIGGRIRPAAP